MRTYRIQSGVTVGALGLLLAACGGSSASILGGDAGTDAKSVGDATGHIDTGGKKPSSDGGGHDAGGHETGAKEAGAPEAGSNEASTSEAATNEAGAADTGLVDTGMSADVGVDAGGHDAGQDAGHVDAGLALCGDGTLDPGEQCDDGNRLDLDGCDSECHYELVTRLNTFAISGDTGPSFCVHPKNAIGTKVLTSLALGQLNPPLDTDISAGTLNIFIDLLGLSNDLTGATNATGVTLGLLDGEPDPAKGTWPGSSTIDWWYLADHAGITAGLPTTTLPGAVTAKTLTGGPGSVSFVLLGGPVTMNNAKVVAAIAAADDTPAPPPTKIETGLTVLETMTANGTGQGLCGDVTVASLAVIPIPQALTTGDGNCTQGYTYCGAGNPVSATCNSLLDVFVSGCSVLGGLATAANATQPDVGATGGTPKTLTAGTNHKVPTSQSSGDDDAYSLYATFTVQRVHFTGETCTATSDCQTTQTCSTAGVCQ